jgi:hypothetical protein
MDALACPECGFDTDDHVAKLHETREENKKLKDQRDELKDRVTQLRVDAAEAGGDDAKIGTTLIRKLALVLIFITLGFTTCEITPVITQEIGHTEVSRMTAAVEAGFVKCEQEADSDAERNECFKMFNKSIEELINLVKAKQSGTVVNPVAP